MRRRLRGWGECTCILFYFIGPLRRKKERKAKEINSDRSKFRPLEGIKKKFLPAEETFLSLSLGGSWKIHRSERKSKQKRSKNKIDTDAMSSTTTTVAAPGGMSSTELEAVMRQATTTASTHRGSLSRGADPTKVNVRGLVVKAERLPDSKNSENKGGQSKRGWDAAKVTIIPAIFFKSQYDKLPRHLCIARNDERGRPVLGLVIRRQGERGVRLSDDQKVPESEKNYEFFEIRPMEEVTVTVWGYTPEQCKPSDLYMPFVDLLDVAAVKKFPDESKHQGAGDSRAGEGYSGAPIANSNSNEKKKPKFFINLGAGGIDFYDNFATQDMFSFFERSPDEHWFLPTPEDLPMTFSPGNSQRYVKEPLSFIGWDKLRLRERVSGNHHECVAFKPSIKASDWISAAKEPHMMLEGVARKWGNGDSVARLVSVNLKVYRDRLTPLGFSHLPEIWENVAPFAVANCPFVGKGWATQDCRTIPVNRRYVQTPRASETSSSTDLVECGPLPLKPKGSSADKEFDYALDLVAVDMYYDMTTFLTERLFPVTAQWVAKRAGVLCCNDQPSKDVDPESPYVCITGTYTNDPRDTRAMMSTFVPLVKTGEGEFRVATNHYFRNNDQAREVKGLTAKQGDRMLDEPDARPTGCPFEVSHMGGRPFYVLYYVAKRRSSGPDIAAYMGISARPSLEAPPPVLPDPPPSREERKVLPKDRPRGATGSSPYKKKKAASPDPAPSQNKARIASPPASDSEETTDDEDDSN